MSAKPNKNYHIAIVKNNQVLIKMSTVNDTYAIEFYAYNDTNSEVSYSLTFKDIELRNSLFLLICSPTEYSNGFVTTIFNKYLATEATA